MKFQATRATKVQTACLERFEVAGLARAWRLGSGEFPGPQQAQQTLTA